MEDQEIIKVLLKGSINELLCNDNDSKFGFETLSDAITFTIDKDLRLFIGWENGFGKEKRDELIQSKKDPDYALCYKIVQRNNLRSDCNDWEYLWDARTESYSIDSNYQNHIDDWCKSIIQNVEEIEKEEEKRKELEDEMGE